MVGQSQVFVLIVILVVGIVFGAGVTWWMLASRKSNSPKVELDSASIELAALRSRYSEQAGLWHEKRSGKLVLRLENQMVDVAGQLNPNQRARLEVLTKEWLAWLGITLPAAPAEAASNGPAIALPGPQVPPTPAPRPSQPAQRTAPLTAPVPAPAAAAAPAKPQSIVEQIDAILQEKLVNSTSSQKGVRLVEDPQHGVVVWIGLDHYDGVDRVTDPEVRSLLRESAEEWERRATLLTKK